MTTLTTIPGTHVVADVPIPFSRLVRAELRKLTDTRISRWLLVALLGLTPLVVLVMVFVAKPADLSYEKLIDAGQAPEKFLLPTLGILTMTSEWSQRTGLTTFTLVPNRRRVLLAKFTSAIALGLVVVVVAFGAAAIGNLLGGLRNGNGSWSFGAAGFGEITLVQLSGLIEGMAFGMALLIPAAALAVYYLVPTVWSALDGASGGLERVAPWLDLNKAQSGMYTHSITGTGWDHLAIASTIWILLPLVFGVVRVSRTEVKSG
jgi:hypothetical protein